LSPVEQILASPPYAPSIAPDKYVSDVKERSGSFLLNYWGFDRHIADAVAWYFTGFFATKND